MIVEASVATIPPLQSAIFDWPHTPVTVPPASEHNNQQQESATERRNLVNRIDDLCDCV